MREQLKPENLNELAEKIKNSLGLNYDSDGVARLDNLIDQWRNKTDKEPSDLLILGYGACYGRCIIETYGGEWIFKEEIKDWLVRVNSKLSANPFVKVGKQFYNGPEDSIYLNFIAIPLLIEGRYKDLEELGFEFIKR